jgi:hypothetical protein
MSLEAAVRNMLDGTAQLAAHPISHGYRPQLTALPAITYEITSNERSATKDHWQAVVDVRVIAVTTEDALDIAAYVPSACDTGTYNGLEFTAVMFDGYTVDAPSVGEGDEQQPAEVSNTITIHYKE